MGRLMVSFPNLVVEDDAAAFRAALEDDDGGAVVVVHPTLGPLLCCTNRVRIEGTGDFAAAVEISPVGRAALGTALARPAGVDRWTVGAAHECGCSVGPVLCEDPVSAICAAACMAVALADVAAKREVAHV